MFAQVLDKGTLERSMNKSMDKEYDGFDQIRSNMDTVYQIGKTALKGVKQTADLVNDFNDAADSVNQASSKRQRTSTEPGVYVSKDGRTSVQKITQSTPVGFSSLNNIGTYEGIGSSGTAIIGNKTSPPISMKLGKQLFSTTSIDNFLSLFNQTGTISSSFGGRLLVPQDQRSRIYHCFRHNLHSPPVGSNLNSGITENAAYPSTANILTVQGDMTILGKTLSNAPMQSCTDGSVYFAPYNKPDLEDVSFNLNKFKLGPVSTQGDPPDNDDENKGDAVVSMVSTPWPYNGTDYQTFSPNKIALLNDVSIMEMDKHRSDSAIYQNNSRAAQYTSGTSYTSAPYKYDAVLKQGIVDYLFMNKGIGPLAVEVVVYRVKANGAQGIPSKFAEFDLNAQLEQVISKGNYQKYLGGFGTDDLGPASGITGKRTTASWYTDPDLPFLPSCRQIDQSELAYKEVQRIKVCLQPG
jgi:hypothetical protein